jgi:hypothetical protein
MGNSLRVTNEVTPAIMKMSQRLGLAMVDGTFEAAQHIEGCIKKTINDMFPKARTGGLMKSYAAQFIENRNGTISAGAFSSLIYAEIQDKGGTINKKDKMLSIPLRKLPVGKWPRHFAKGYLTFIKSKKGKSLLVHFVGKRRKDGTQKMQPYFLLRESVTLKGKRYLAVAQSAATPGVEQILGHKVDLEITAAGLQI